MQKKIYTVYITKKPFDSKYLQEKAKKKQDLKDAEKKVVQMNYALYRLTYSRLKPKIKKKLQNRLGY